MLQYYSMLMFHVRLPSTIGVVQLQGSTSIFDQAGEPEDLKINQEEADALESWLAASSDWPAIRMSSRATSHW
jgi:hypothetical protein